MCVFLFGGNDSNNTIIPMDDTNFQAYTSIRGSLALTAAELSQTVYSGSAPVRVSREAAGAGQHVLVEGTGGGGQCRVAGAAADARAVSGRSRSPVPLNLFSHSDQQLQWQTSVAQGNSPTGWAGRAADYIEAQKINSSNFPVFFSVAGNALMGDGRDHAAGGASRRAGRCRCPDSLPQRHRRRDYNALTSLLTLDSGVSLAQAANNTLSNSLTTRPRSTRRWPRAPS